LIDPSSAAPVRQSVQTVEDGFSNHPILGFAARTKDLMAVPLPPLLVKNALNVGRQPIIVPQANRMNRGIEQPDTLATKLAENFNLPPQPLVEIVSV
jgi:hypothetical protein